MKKIFLNSAILLIVVFLSLTGASAQKLTAEEIISKHLDSIGKKEKREAIKNRFILTDLRYNLKGSAAPASGKAVLVSEGNKNLWGFNLNLNDYPLDRFAFDGKETRVGFVRPGIRSFLGGFIFNNKELLKEGLLGGTLFSSWALLNSVEKKPKINLEGIKKIDNNQAYILSYSPKNGSDLSIKMYFDTELFRHVRTEYSLVIAARQGSNVDNSAGQSPDYYKLTEEFSNFSEINGITIPKMYKISYSYTGNVGKVSRDLEWIFDVTNFSFNQQLDQNTFNINAK